MEAEQKSNDEKDIIYMHENVTIKMVGGAAAFSVAPVLSIQSEAWDQV